MRGRKGERETGIEGEGVGKQRWKEGVKCRGREVEGEGREGEICILSGILIYFNFVITASL